MPWHQPILPVLRPHKRLLLRYYETLQDMIYRFEIIMAMTLTSLQNPPHVYSNRTVILARKKQNDRLHVLVSEKPSVHLPLCQINPMGSLYFTLASFLKEIFEAWLFPNEVICFRINHSLQNNYLITSFIYVCTSANLSRLP